MASSIKIPTIFCWTTPFDYRHYLIGPYIGYAIFIDTPLDIALARRLLRDYGNGDEKKLLADMQYYLNHGRQAYINGSAAGRAKADLVIDGSRSVAEMVKELTSKFV